MPLTFFPLAEFAENFFPPLSWVFVPCPWFHWLDSGCRCQRCLRHSNAWAPSQSPHSFLAWVLSVEQIMLQSRLIFSFCSLSCIVHFYHLFLYNLQFLHAPRDTWLISVSCFLSSQISFWQLFQRVPSSSTSFTSGQFLIVLTRLANLFEISFH